MNDMKSKNGEFLMLISIAAFSVSDIFDRIAMWKTNPFMATLIKSSVICLFVFFVLLFRGFEFKNAKYFVASGLISEIIGSSSFMYAISHGINVALPTIQTQVVFTAIFSLLLLKERINRRSTLGIAVLVFGLALLNYSRTMGSESTDWVVGFVFAIFASIGWGMGAVLWKYGIEKGASANSGLLVHYLTAIISIFFILFLFDRSAFAVELKDVGNLTIAAILDGILGMLALIHAMKYMSATRAQALKSIYPVFACVLAFFIFKEGITSLMFVGIFLASAGVILFELGKKSNKQQE
jgi:drug/metabolite transporter (DMT)-like permease